MLSVVLAQLDHDNVHKPSDDPMQEMVLEAILEFHDRIH